MNNYSSWNYSKPESSVQVIVAITGVLNRASTLARTLNKSPSFAIAYKTRGMPHTDVSRLKKQNDGFMCVSFFDSLAQNGSNIIIALTSSHYKRKWWNTIFLCDSWKPYLIIVTIIADNVRVFAKILFFLQLPLFDILKSLFHTKYRPI